MSLQDQNLDSGSSTPTVATDWPDYAPGSTATISATGFDAGSTVMFSIQTIGAGADGIIGTADDTLSAPVTWLATDGAASDGDGTTNGNLTTGFYVNQSYANTTMLLTATEVQVGADGSVAAAGPTATEVFTDLLGPATSIVKTVDAANPYTDNNHDHLLNAGDVIHYDIVVTNTGSVPLPVTVTDTMPDGSLVTLSGAPATFAAGFSYTYHVDYTITQADVDKGHVGAPDQLTNSATVTTPAPNTTHTSTVTTVIDYTPGLSILKTISSITDSNNDGKTDAGDVVNYNVHVANTGDVTLTGVTVNDPLTGGVISTGQTIAVGGSEDIGASYTLTQGDVDLKGNPVNSGLISNTASVTDDQGNSGSSTVTTPVDYTPGLSIMKTVSSITDTNNNGLYDAGDVVNYNVHVANTGDVTLTGVTVNDPLDRRGDLQRPDHRRRRQRRHRGELHADPGRRRQ